MGLVALADRFGNIIGEEERGVAQRKGLRMAVEYLVLIEDNPQRRNMKKILEAPRRLEWKSIEGGGVHRLIGEHRDPKRDATAFEGALRCWTKEGRPEHLKREGKEGENYLARQLRYARVGGPVTVDGENQYFHLWIGYHDTKRFGILEFDQNEYEGPGRFITVGKDLIELFQSVPQGYREQVVDAVGKALKHDPYNHPADWNHSERFYERQWNIVDEGDGPHKVFLPEQKLIRRDVPFWEGMEPKDMSPYRDGNQSA